MTKRIRYIGPYEEVRVAVANQGDVYTEQFVTVKRNGLLPLEQDNGDAVPAAVRDELLANNPDFSEVNQAAPKATNDKDGES